jgi:hypothetical protein
VLPGERRETAVTLVALMLAPEQTRSVPWPTMWFSPLNGWPTHSPVNASPQPSRTVTHDSGASVTRYISLLHGPDRWLVGGSWVG